MNIFLILHLLGVAIGAGGAFVGDTLFLAAAHDRKLSADEVRMMNIAGYITWVGLFLLILSGLGLFLERPDELLQSSKFLLKMTVVGIIFVNGIVLHAYHTPHIKKHINLPFHKSKSFMQRSRLMLVSGSVSLVSWGIAIILGALKSIPVTYSEALLSYLGLLLVSILITQALRPIILGIKHSRN